jgi:hypothetical protein
MSAARPGSRQRKPLRGRCRQQGERGEQVGGVDARNERASDRCSGQAPPPVLCSTAFDWAVRLQAIPGRKAAVRLPGAGVGRGGAVAAQHRLGAPAGKPHQVGPFAAGSAP